MNAMTDSWSFLRRALLADGVATAATGLLMLIGATPLSSLLGLNETLLRTAGLSLIPFSAFVAYLSLRTHIPSGAVWAVVAVNLLWVIDSVLLLVAGWASPTTWGYLFTGGQAFAVAVFAALEYAGLRRSAPAMA